MPEYFEKLEVKDAKEAFIKTLVQSHENITRSVALALWERYWRKLKDCASVVETI